MGDETSGAYLVTGSMGCIGAWVLYHLLQSGSSAVSFDIGDSRHRLDLLLTPDEQRAIHFVRGDLVDKVQLLAACREHGVTRIIHLAALQVPFCRANPSLGAQVNVTGTVNVFEAARELGLTNVTYASSIAVYGPAEDYPPGPISHDALPAPRTLYGVYKVANEGSARIYYQDNGISSTALRPYTVYGLGRDQGLTSDPTKAMLAAVAGRPFHIAFGGAMQFQLASDVALQFIQAARHPREGAHAFNLGPAPTSIAEVVRLIQAEVPSAQITHATNRLPFPEHFDDTVFRAHAHTLYETPLSTGIEQTMADFRRLLVDGRIKMEA